MRPMGKRRQSPQVAAAAAQSVWFEPGIGKPFRLGGAAEARLRLQLHEASDRGRILLGLILVVADKAQPAPARVTSMVLYISTPEVRSTALSTVTETISSSAASTGFSFQKASLRCRLARLASLSSVSVVEPATSTSRFGVLSVI